MLERMKKMLLLSIYCGLGLIVLNNCSNDYPNSLYNPDSSVKPNPTISQIMPDFALAGVDQVTIIGTNFSTIANENTVYFNAAKAIVLSSNENNIIVKAPTLPADSIRVKVEVAGAENFSNIELYRLHPAVDIAFPFQAYQEPYTVTSDELGNLYFSLVEESAGKGVYQISADGVLSEFAPKGGETTFYDLKYSSEGYLIGVYGNKAVFKIEAGVKPAVIVNTNNNNIKLYAFDFDKDKTIWAGGKGGKIVSIKPDLSFKLFDYEFDISALRVFNGFLYAITSDVTSQNIIRFPIISPDSLGADELIFPFTSNVDIGIEANSLTFSENGQMYIATSPSSTNADPIMFLNSDGSFGTWYPGLISSSASSFTWGSGSELFIVRDRYPVDRAIGATFTQNIIKINMRMLGAPEFGRE